MERSDPPSNRAPEACRLDNKIQRRSLKTSRKKQKRIFFPLAPRCSLSALNEIIEVLIQPVELWHLNNIYVKTLQSLPKQRVLPAAQHMGAVVEGGGPFCSQITIRFSHTLWMFSLTAAAYFAVLLMTTRKTTKVGTEISHLTWPLTQTNTRTRATASLCGRGLMFICVRMCCGNARDMRVSDSKRCAEVWGFGCIWNRKLSENIIFLEDDRPQSPHAPTALHPTCSLWSINLYFLPHTRFPIQYSCHWL